MSMESLPSLSWISSEIADASPEKKLKSTFDIGVLNGLFVLGRTIGFIGKCFDL